MKPMAEAIGEISTSAKMTCLAPLGRNEADGRSHRREFPPVERSTTLLGRNEADGRSHRRGHPSMSPQNADPIGCFAGGYFNHPYLSPNRAP